MLDDREDPRDAWDGLVAEYGERVAVAARFGNQLIVSWHYSDKTIAWRIRQAFRAAGMHATWGSEKWDAVHVDLAYTR